MIKRIVQIVVSIGLCTELVYAADWRRVGGELSQLQGSWLALALILFIPQTVVSAWRWRGMIADTAKIDLLLSLRQTLAASALNLVVPSKLGDFSKAAFVPVTAGGERRRLAVLVAVEKAADLAMLFVAMIAGTRFGFVGVGCAIGASFLFCLAGQWLIRQRAQWKVNRYLPASPLPFLAASVVLWTLHLAQIHLFLLAADVPTTFAMTAARVPAALLAGIIPAAFCGIGTRDAAFVWLFADVAPASTMTVVGMLTALRYVVPGAIGIPLLASLRRAPATVPSPIGKSPNRRPRLRSAETAATR